MWKDIVKRYFGTHATEINSYAKGFCNGDREAKVLYRDGIGRGWRGDINVKHSSRN